MTRRQPKTLQEETMPETTPETPVETPVETVEIQLLGSTHGAEPNAVRTVTRAKADKLIANGLAVEATPAGDESELVQVEGVLAESDTAGRGPAVNAETGQVTQPGEPLPAIAQAGGEPLKPIKGSDRNGEPLDADANGVLDVLERQGEDDKA